MFSGKVGAKSSAFKEFCQQAKRSILTSNQSANCVSLNGHIVHLNSCEKFAEVDDFAGASLLVVTVQTEQDVSDDIKMHFIFKM